MWLNIDRPWGLSNFIDNSDCIDCTGGIAEIRHLAATRRLLSGPALSSQSV